MTLTEVRRLLADLELRPRKALGQNFLVDRNILEIILHEADVRSEDTVLEVGPGLGILTAALIRCTRRVVAIEKDRHLCQYLRTQFSGLELIEGDAMDVLRAGTLHLPSSFRVVANLPYNLSTPLLEQWVEGRYRPQKMVLTLQREVAERLAARPRSKEYGALTLFTQLRYHVTIVHGVSARCFYPEPGVQSAVVALDRREPRVRLLADAPFHTLVRQGFSQRRKMLRNLVTGSEAVLPTLGLPVTARAEELSLEQWISLANTLKTRLWVPAG